MKPKHQRLLFILCAAILVGCAVTLFLRTIDEYVVYFHAPADIAVNPPSSDTIIRVGGMVKDGSIIANGEHITFTVTDYSHDVMIDYTGTLPSLFREGQGIVAEGTYRDGTFYASTILAKHDEYYMPPEVAKTLKSEDWKKKANETITAE